MKAKELVQKSVQELEQELIALRREQFNLRMQKGAGQVTQPHRFEMVKKDIARIKTVISSKAGNAR